MNKLVQKIDKAIAQNNFQSYLTKKYFGYFVICCFGLLGFYLNWGLKEIILVIFLLYIFLNPLGSKILARLGILFLMLGSIILASGNSIKAEYCAELAYLVFVVAVVTAIHESHKEEK